MGTTCGRCGGRVCAVGEVRHVARVEMYVWPVEWMEGAMRRCVNCGAYSDGVIETNRRRQLAGEDVAPVVRAGWPGWGG